MLLRKNFFQKGLTLMKIILSSYYWGFKLLKRGVHKFEKGIHIFGKRGSRL